MQIDELQLLASRRSDSPLFARLASEYLEQGNTTQAIELCQTGINSYPSYVTGFYVLAKSYLKESMFEDAIATLNQARKLFPDCELFIQLKREWGANTPAVHAPQLQPTATTTQQQTPQDGEIVSQTLAEIYVQQGLIDEAIKSYEQLKKRKPDQIAEFDKRIKELEKKLGKIGKK